MVTVPDGTHCGRLHGRSLAKIRASQSVNRQCDMVFGAQGCEENLMVALYVLTNSYNDYRIHIDYIIACCLLNMPLVAERQKFLLCTFEVK